MNTLFQFFVSASVIALLVGIIKPSLLKLETRIRVVTVCGIAILVFMTLGAVIAPASPDASQTSISAQPQATAPTPDEIKAQQQADAKAQAQRDADAKAWALSKAGKICAAHPTWAHDECTELASNKSWITNAAHLGMTYEMLVYLRGEADHENRSNYGNGTVYQYCWDGYDPSCFYDRDGDGHMDAFN
jgi:hypothetical protein